MTRAHEKGLSAIEALVALAVVAIAFVPLIGLQGQIARDQARAQQVRTAVTAERNALAIMRDLNVMQEPRGARDLGGGATLRWTVAPLSRTVRANARSEDAAFDVALYRVTMTVTGRALSEPVTLSIDQVGWRAIAAPPRERPS